MFSRTLVGGFVIALENKIKPLFSAVPRRGVFRTVLVLSLFCSLANPPYARGAAITIKDVKVEGLASIKEDELLYLLGIKPGTTVEDDDVTRGIKRAFKAQIFDEITVEADEAVEGLVRVKVREKTFVESIKVSGNERVRKKFLLEHLAFREGKTLRPEAFDEERKRMLALVARKGFPRADLAFTVEEAGPYRARVTLVLNEGEPLYVRRIVFVGTRPEGTDLSIGLQPGDIYDQFRLEEGIENTRALLKQMGYVKPLVGPYSFDGDSGVLTVNIDPGIRVVVGLTGNDSVGDKKLLEVLPFSVAGAVRTDLVEEAVNNIRAVYYEGGFPNVQVAPVVSREEGVVRVDFFINEGTKVVVDSVVLSGVTLPEDGLRKIMSIKPGAVYNISLLESDVQRLEEFYHALGYSDATVREPEVIISGAVATITITVEEGQKRVYSDVMVRGVKAVPMGDVVGAIKIKAGDPYNEVDILDSRRAVVNLFRGRGFLDVDVRVETEFQEAGAAVTFRIDEGEMKLFGKTVVAADMSTRTEVVRRELRYSEGEPLNASRLVDARQRLYRLGLFEKVEIEVAGGEGAEQDIVINTEEGKPGTVDLGLGYSDYERLRGFVDVRYRNLFGMNRQASTRVDVSSISNRQLLNYQEPWFLGRKLPANVYLIREERDEKNIDTGEIRYRVRKHTARAGVEKQLTERVKADLTYEFSVVKTFDVQPDVVLTKEDTGTLAISGIIPSVAYDTRDNPFDPQRGFFTGASVKFATSLLLSETDFVKITMHASAYRKLSKRFVLALALRGGFAQGFKETEELPLIERFFLGGRNTVRGFDQDELGPKGEDGTPTGGNVFALGNFEVRTSISDKWRLVTFFDSGNVWVKTGDVDLGELRYTAGLGLQYNTPVGPIRVDYGHKVDREPGESSGEVHFSIGHAF